MSGHPESIARVAGSVQSDTDDSRDDHSSELLTGAENADDFSPVDPKENDIGMAFDTPSAHALANAVVGAPFFPTFGGPDNPSSHLSEGLSTDPNISSYEPLPVPNFASSHPSASSPNAVFGPYDFSGSLPPSVPSFASSNPSALSPSAVVDPSHFPAIEGPADTLSHHSELEEHFTEQDSSGTLPLSVPNFASSNFSASNSNAVKPPFLVPVSQIMASHQRTRHTHVDPRQPFHPFTVPHVDFGRDSSNMMLGYSSTEDDVTYEAVAQLWDGPGEEAPSKIWVEWIPSQHAYLGGAAPEGHPPQLLYDLEPHIRLPAASNSEDDDDSDANRDGRDRDDPDDTKKFYLEDEEYISENVDYRPLMMNEMYDFDEDMHNPDPDDTMEMSNVFNSGNVAHSFMVDEDFWMDENDGDPDELGTANYDSELPPPFLFSAAPSVPAPENSLLEAQETIMNYVLGADTTAEEPISFSSPGHHNTFSSSSSQYSVDSLDEFDDPDPPPTVTPVTLEQSTPARMLVCIHDTGDAIFIDNS